jgi:hypothetical protein
MLKVKNFVPSTETRLWRSATSYSHAEKIAKKERWQSYEIIQTNSQILEWVVIKND